MPTHLELCYWYSPWPGHMGLKIWDTKHPEIGYYVSSENRAAVKECIRTGATMDYEDFFQKELVHYGYKCIKMRLTSTRLTLGVITANADILEPEYSLQSNNCAHIAARMLEAFQYFKNNKISRMQYLEPKSLYFAICGQGTSFHPVTAIEYAYAQINADLATLKAFGQDLAKRGYNDAAVTTTVLIANVKQELMNFALVEPKTIQEWQKVQASITKIIAESDPVLSEHRGYKKLIGNLLLSILMLGIIYAMAILIKGAITGKFLFFSDTKTSAVSNRIAENVKEAHFVPANSDIKEQKVHFDEKKYEVKI